MENELVTIQALFFRWTKTDHPDHEELDSKIMSQLPDAVGIHSMPTSYKMDYVFNDETAQKILSERLTADDYRLLEREYGDLKDIRQSELIKIGKPYPRGGGSGPLIDYVLQLLNSDAAVAAATITATSVIVKEIFRLYFHKDDGRKLRLKRGDDEIDLTGYSKEDAERLIDDFFEKVRREILTK